MTIPSNLKGKALTDFLVKHKKKIIKSKMEGMKITDPVGIKSHKPHTHDN
jgi:hypothetical protein